MLLYLRMVSVLFIATSINIASASIFDPGDYELMASVQTSGLYNLNGLITWNGQPLSPTNMPNDAQRKLEATLNFYSSSAEKNVLIVQVDEVVTTVGAFWFGTPFTNVSQTGLTFTFPSGHSPGTPVFVDQFANLGQERRFGPPTGSAEPLMSTPGYELDELLPNNYSIETSNGSDNAFTSLGNISNATRIFGGGVFQLTFDTTFNLFNYNYAGMTASSIYGIDNQEIVGTLIFSRDASVVPEPSTAILACLYFVALLSRVTQN